MAQNKHAIIAGEALDDLAQYNSVLDIFNASCKTYADKPAFENFGYTITYGDLDRLSAQFASYLQNHTNLQPGDRVALQLPNILQYPVASFGIMRAGMVLVNTNPLYTDNEMEHQFNDSSVKAIVILANMASKLEEIIGHTGIEHVIITEMVDLHPQPKRFLINNVVKYIKKMVPKYHLPKAVKFRNALRKGAEKAYSPVQGDFDDTAVLQYTGGTTGVAKGAMLTHRNLVANMLQTKKAISGSIGEGCEKFVSPLPVYHIYTFTLGLVMIATGNASLFITNPRDLPNMIKSIKKTKFTGFVGLNTLFVALCNDEDFKALDFSDLKITTSGGMALTKDAALKWQEVTGCEISEGYGMTETSPVLTFNRPGEAQLGTVGTPVPDTEICVFGEDGSMLGYGEAGELACKGPQIMKGYWQRPEATEQTFLDGWLLTGDMAVLQEDGYIKIVDRKKDLIIVSGFNVYPNEVEDFISNHPDIVECAAVGVPHPAKGETVKLYVVKSMPDLTVEEIIAYAKEGLTGYKVPRDIEFRDELPKSAVGKILRRELRDG